MIFHDQCRVVWGEEKRWNYGAVAGVCRLGPEGYLGFPNEHSKDVKDSELFVPF